MQLRQARDVDLQGRFRRDLPEDRHEETDTGERHALTLLVIAHLPLGYALSLHPLLATAHALLTLAVGVRFALDPDRPQALAAVLAYIVGFDVFWRMNDALVFHQFGKYAVVGLAGLWMIHTGSWRRSFGPIAYFALLVPSIAVSTDVATLDYIKDRASFNLSGPLCLAVSVIFFRQFSLRRDDFLRIVIAFVAAIVAVLSVTLTSTLSAHDLHFNLESNFVTSGGYGPNQVSSILGLGGALMLLIPVLWSVTAGEALLLVGGAVVMFANCALTFSRGGLYGGIAPILLAGLLLLRDPEFRARVAPIAALLVIVVSVFLLPGLDRFTEGRFAERISDRNMAGREELMARDLALWKQKPLFGVGPGMSKLNRVEGIESMIAHTEFTRLVAEHGTLGIAALLILVVLGITSVVGAPSGVPRALAVCLVAWSLLYMTHAAMRLAAPGFLFGVAAAIGSLRAEDWDQEVAT